MCTSPCNTRGNPSRDLPRSEPSLSLYRIEYLREDRHFLGLIYCTYSVTGRVITVAHPDIKFWTEGGGGLLTVKNLT